MNHLPPQLWGGGGEFDVNTSDVQRMQTTVYDEEESLVLDYSRTSKCGHLRIAATSQ